MARARLYALIGVLLALAAGVHRANAQDPPSIIVDEVLQAPGTCTSSNVTYNVVAHVKDVPVAKNNVAIGVTPAGFCQPPIVHLNATVFANFTFACTVPAYDMPELIVRAYQYNTSHTPVGPGGFQEYQANATETWTPVLLPVKPLAKIISYAQDPKITDATMLNQTVSLTITHKFAGVSFANNASRIEEPPHNCTLDLPENFGTTLFDDTIAYTCNFTRSSIPETMTWTAKSNATTAGCPTEVVWRRSAYINDALTIATEPEAAMAEQQCGSTYNGLATYKVTLKVTGAKQVDMSADSNCTKTSGSLDQTKDGGIAGHLGVAPLVYTCVKTFDNATAARTVTFTAVAVNGARTQPLAVSLPTSKVATQPKATIASVEQKLLLPRTGSVSGVNPTNVYLTVGVEVEKAPTEADIIAPSGRCTAITNLTALAYPFTGSISYNCSYLITTYLPSADKIEAKDFEFWVKTPANGCFAKASRDVNIVFEPAVTIAHNLTKQGCMASANSPVTYKVAVNYMGAKKEFAAPSGCTKSGALGAWGNGTIVWSCTFASAAAATNATLNFTAAGLIDGEFKSILVSVPAPVVAVAPAVEVTKLPAQISLLKANDTRSKVNFTVSAKFTGAVGGAWSSVSDAVCKPKQNVTAARDVSPWTVDYSCTFDRSTLVPANITFMSLTAAADCFAEVTRAVVVDFEDPVFAQPSLPAQRCLVNLKDPVSYDVAVALSGARANNTWPSACTQLEKDLDGKGTGAAAYVCTFPNATAVAPLSFSAEGIVPGDVGVPAVVTPPAAVVAGKPTLKVLPAQQDIVKGNQSWVAYTLNTESLGADLVRLSHSNGSCALLPTTSAARVALFDVDGESLYKLTSVNVTTKLTFACNFSDASAIPKAIAVDAGLSTATGCIESKEANISVVRAPAGAFVPYVYSLHFDGMDYDDIVKPSAADRLMAFKMAVRTKVAAAVGLPLGNVEVSNITKGSVIAEVVLQTPSAWTADQVNRAADLLTDSPGDVFDAAFLDQYGITGVTVTSVTQLPPRPSGLSKSAQIGIGVGVGVGALAVVGGGVAFAVARKRRASVEPRDHMA